MKTIMLRRLFSVLLTISLVSCVKNPEDSIIHVTGITLDQTTVEMYPGGSAVLTATVSPSNADNKLVIWSVDNAKIAKVNNGVVTAVGEGTTTVTAKSDDGGKTATCKIIVLKKTIPVSGVKLSNTTATITEGETFTLTATVLPDDATNKNVSWKSDNNTVAFVSSDGVVSAISAGTAKITVTNEDQSKTATCDVTVTPATVSVTSVSLDKTSLSMTVGETETLTAAVNPANATNKAVTWSSSNTSVAAVSSSGVVSAKAAGYATITVTTNDGGKSATCSITVTSPSTNMENGHEWVDLGLPSGLKWATCNVGATAPEENGTYFAWGETEPKNKYDWSTYKWCNGSDKTLTKYNINGSYGPVVDNKTILEPADDAARTNWGGTWRIPTKAEYDELINNSNCTKEWITQNGVKGCKITSKMNGNSIFLPTAGFWRDSSQGSDGICGVCWSSSILDYPVRAGGFYFDFYQNSSRFFTQDYERYVGVTVRPVTDKGVRVSVTGISIDKTSHTLSVGETATINATVSPSNATQPNIIWSSSNTSVATVSYKGVVTAVASGSATITATTYDGGKTKTCAITVNPATVAVTSVSLDKNTLSLTEGDTYTLAATVNPANATNKAVTWSSSNTSVATVSASGGVTAKAVGTATITVKTADGNKTATCTVTVIPATVAVTSVNLNKTSLSMTVGETETLTATVNPANATNKAVTWSSNNTGVATVSDSGVVTAKAEGQTNIVVTSDDGGFTSVCSVDVSKRDPIIEAVDLGLSVNWATCNIGAYAPEEYGDYFAWGETEPKDVYGSGNYKWESNDKLTKYIHTSGVGGLVVDNKTILEMADDAAQTQWDGDWRMPTDKEFRELLANCNAEGISINGVSGNKYTSKLNGNSIFLPAAGRIQNEWNDSRNSGFYWSSSLDVGDDNPYISYALLFNAEHADGIITWSYRYRGMPIRPVIANPNVELGNILVNKNTMFVGEMQMLTTNISSTNATPIHWASSNPEVATINNAAIVTALQPGKTTITASLGNNGYSTSCQITVESVPVSFITLSGRDYEYAPGQTGQKMGLTARVYPVNATDKTLWWSSSNTAVATVDANGMVTAKSDGIATITVTTNDGGHTASVTIVVKTPEPSYTIHKILTGCSIDNYINSVKPGGKYIATISPLPNNTLQSITCTMGGVPQVVNNNTINIPSVTGDIIINATAFCGVPGAEESVYIAWCEDNRTVPAIPDYAIHTNTINNTLNGTFDTVNLSDGYGLFIWAPIGVTIPGYGQWVALEGTQSPFIQLTDFRTIGYYNGMVVYQGTGHNGVFPMHFYAGIYTIQFNGATASTPADYFLLYYDIADNNNDYSLPADAFCREMQSIVTNDNADFGITISKAPGWLRLWIPEDQGNLDGIIITQFCVQNDNPNTPINTLLHRVGTTTVYSKHYSVYDAYTLNNDEPLVYTSKHTIGMYNVCKFSYQ